MELGPEDFSAVIGAHEQPDDVARNPRAELRTAIPGFHLVRDQRLDLDDLATPRAVGRVDERVGHGYASSRQAARVTTTAAVADQNEPSLSSPIAVTVGVVASGMRVDPRARPARAPRRKLTTSGWGFSSVNTWMARTWSAGVIALSTLTVSGTVLPFSDSGGSSSLTRPFVTGAEPTIFLIASCASWGVARAGTTVMPAPRPSPAAAPTKNSRREVSPSINPSAWSRRPPHPRSARRSGWACRATPARPA